MTDLSGNPYVAAHMTAEAAFNEGVPREVWERRLRAEYEGMPPRPCDCGGTAWFKATIGVRKCDRCGALWHDDGTKV